MSKKLLKSGAIVSAMTLVSRVLGLVRDVVIANLMGAGAQADVFFLANKIPNFLRRLFAEGAFAQAFVPVLAQYKEQKPDEVQELIAKVSGTLGVLVSIVTLVGVIASPIIIALFANGWFIAWLNDEPIGQNFELASELLRWTFPYLFFITLTALSGALLNTYGKFAAAAFTPALLNVSIISVAIWVAPNMAKPELGLAFGVFIGGVTQFLFQIPFLKRAGLLVRPTWGWSHPGVKKIRTLMIPALFGVSVSQINLLLDTVIASFLMAGSISWLYYSDRLLEFPLGLLGIAIATVILPALSRRHAQVDTSGYQKTMSWGIICVLVTGIPALAALILLAKPMLMVLFMRGEFTPEDVNMASMSLMAYASGLVSFMLIKVLAPGYYSRQDTKTPVKIGIIAMVSNMVFNLILVFPFGYVGLALATSASALLNMGLLYAGLHKRNIYQVDRSVVLVAMRAVLATGVMVFVITQWLPPFDIWLSNDLAWRIQMLAQLIAVGLISYVLSLIIFGGRMKDFKTH